MKSLAQTARFYGINRATLECFLNGRTTTSYVVCSAFHEKHPEKIAQWTQSAQEPMFIKVSRSEQKDYWKSGLQDSMKKSKTLNEKMIQRIRNYLSQSPKSTPDLEKEYNLSHGSMYRFLHGNVITSPKIYESFVKKHPELIAQWSPSSEIPESVNTQHKSILRDWKSHLEYLKQNPESTDNEIMLNIRIYLLEDLIQNPRSMKVISSEYGVNRTLMLYFLTLGVQTSNSILEAFKEKHPDLVSQWSPVSEVPESFQSRQDSILRKWKNRLETLNHDPKPSGHKIMQNIRVHLIEDLIQNPRSTETIASEYGVSRSLMRSFLTLKQENSKAVSEAFKEKHPDLIAKWTEKQSSLDEEQNKE